MKPELEKALTEKIGEVSKDHPGHVIITMVVAEGTGGVEIVTNIDTGQAEAMLLEVGRHLQLKRALSIRRQ